MVSEAKRKANNKYDKKTYERITVRLRVDDDADLIESFEKARAEGKAGRDWLRELKEGK